VDLFLSAGVRQTVERFVAFTRAGERFAVQGVAVNPSLIVHGPPGCGKTQLAKWVAAELDRPLLTARVDAIVSSYLGSTSKNVRNLFDHAVRSRAVLLLDEFDALGKMRDDDRELGELKRVVISLLQNIDAAGPDLVLIAATNHEHLLDPAVWRRFSFKARLGPPDFGARKSILVLALRAFAPPHGVEVLAAMTEGYSGSAIKQGAEDGVRAAILADRATAPPEELVSMVLAALMPDQPPPTDRDALIRLVAERAGECVTHKQVAEFFGVSQPTVSKACSKRKSGA
jgi:SpoVK/Ycf46/Vps4 family AAA+-type ATPase